MRSAYLFVCTIVLFCLFSFPYLRSTLANPIPYPVIMMPEEFIDVTILHYAPGVLLAEVDGGYPFVNMGYSKVKMDYPLPPNSAYISASMDEEPLEWVYNDQIFPTVLGDWPMINWTIAPTPDKFSVSTHYEHLLPFDADENCTFLYAMGTGRYLSTYAKETTAYVNIRMELKYSDLHVYGIGLVNETWTWNPKNYTITEEDGVDIISLTVYSGLFRPLVEDLLIKFIPEEIIVPDDYSTIQEAIDNANQGETIFVRRGTYHENIEIDKPLLLVGEDSDNTFIDGDSAGHPIVKVSADNVTITHFTIRNSGTSMASPLPAVYLYSVRDFDIEENTLVDNDCGILLSNASHGKLEKNSIANNTRFGIYVTGDSSNNSIYHNNMINNQYQVYTESAPNDWDDGYEGNYWSDYAGADSDGDGIGDTPYVMGTENQDNYPLMNFYLYCDVNSDGVVNMRDIARCCKAFGSDSSMPNWNSRCDLNDDDRVDMRDIAMACSNFGERYP